MVARHEQKRSGLPSAVRQIQNAKKTAANCAHDTDALWSFNDRRSCRFVRSPVTVTDSTGPTVNPARNPPSSGNRAVGRPFIAATIAALTTRAATLTAPRKWRWLRPKGRADVNTYGPSFRWPPDRVQSTTDERQSTRHQYRAHRAPGQPPAERPPTAHNLDPPWIVGPDTPRRATFRYPRRLGP